MKQAIENLRDKFSQYFECDHEDPNSESYCEIKGQFDGLISMLDYINKPSPKYDDMAYQVTWQIKRALVWVEDHHTEMSEALWCALRAMESFYSGAGYDNDPCTDAQKEFDKE